LLELIARRLAEEKETAPAEELLRVYRLEAEAAERLVVEREKDGYRLKGRPAERAAALINVETREGLVMLRRRLARLGALKMLEQAGAKEGDLIRVGEAEFRLEADRK